MITKEPKKYTKKLVETLYQEDFEKVSETTGNVYPTNRIIAKLYDYSGEYKNKDGENISYSGQKVEITNTKLTLEDGITVKAKKIVNGRVFDNSTTVGLSPEQFIDLVQNVKTDFQKKN